MFYLEVRHADPIAFGNWFMKHFGVDFDNPEPPEGYEYDLDEGFTLEDEGSFGYDLCEEAAKKMVCMFEGITFSLENQYEREEFILTTTINCDGKTLVVNRSLEMYGDDLDDEMGEEVREELEEQRSLYEAECDAPYSAVYSVKELIAEQ